MAHDLGAYKGGVHVRMWITGGGLRLTYSSLPIVGVRLYSLRLFFLTVATVFVLSAFYSRVGGTLGAAWTSGLHWSSAGGLGVECSNAKMITHALIVFRLSPPSLHPPLHTILTPWHGQGGRHRRPCQCLLFPRAARAWLGRSS